MYILENFLEYIVHLIFKFIPRSKNGSLSDVKIIAHRGWHNRQIKENTMKAFSVAVDKNLFGIEFDIRWTKDLIPIIHHDLSLKKSYGIDKEIGELSFEELRELCPDIPKLSEVIDEFGKKICFFIELKKEVWKDLKKQKDILARELANLSPGVDFHFMVLHNSVLLDFNLFPNKEVAVLVSIFNPLEMLDIAIELNVKALTGHFLLLNESIHRKCKANGIFLGTGYTRSQNVMIREFNRGVKWQFTNHPEILLNSMT